MHRQSPRVSAAVMPSQLGRLADAPERAESLDADDVDDDDDGARPSASRRGVRGGDGVSICREEGGKERGGIGAMVDGRPEGLGGGCQSSA